MVRVAHRDWLRVALRPQEALLQFPLAEDSLQPAEAPAHHQLRVGVEEEALLLARSRPQPATCAGSGLCDGPGWCCSVGPGGYSSASCPYAAPQVLRCWPACFPACQARNPIASVPAEMTPAVPGGEEAPPAPEVKETSAIGAPTGGLLLPTPSGN